MDQLRYKRQVSPRLNTYKGQMGKAVLSSPIILTGRGGSGTRLISEHMRAAGIFMGNRLNKSSDSDEWRDLIYELIITKLSRDREISVKLQQNWVRRLQVNAAEILRAGNWATGQPWGWKLPETMLLVPEFFAAFKHAKLVHIVRHPVGSSLRRTHMTSRMNNPVGRAVLSAAYKSIGLDLNLLQEHDVYLHNAITWRFQVELVLKFARGYLTPDRYLEIRYEDLCAEPAAVSRTLLDFVGLPQTATHAIEIDRSRMGGYEPSDPRIDEVWALCAATATELGYRHPLDEANEAGS